MLAQGQETNDKAGLRISVDKFPILPWSVYGVNPHAHNMILESLHTIIFGCGFQKVVYSGNFVYRSDTFSKVLICARSNFL